MSQTLINPVNDRKKLTNGVLIIIAITLLLYFVLPAKDVTFINLLGASASLVTILALYIAYSQILSLKQVAHDTKEKVNDSIRLNKKILMISDLSRKADMVDEIQGYLKSNKIEITIIKMKELKKLLNNLKNDDQYVDLFQKKKFNEVFQTFNIDLDNLHTFQMNDKSKFDKLVMIKNLEELSTLLLGVEVKLKIPQS